METEETYLDSDWNLLKNDNNKKDRPVLYSQVSGF